MGSIGEDEKTEVSEEASEIGKKVTPRLKRLLILLGVVVGLFIIWQTVIITTYFFRLKNHRIISKAAI